MKEQKNKLIEENEFEGSLGYFVTGIFPGFSDFPYQLLHENIMGYTIFKNPQQTKHRGKIIGKNYGKS